MIEEIVQETKLSRLKSFTKEQLLDLHYKQGKSIIEIARMFEVPREYIYTFAKNVGIKIGERKKKAIAERINGPQTQYILNLAASFFKPEDIRIKLLDAFKSDIPLGRIRKLIALKKDYVLEERKRYLADFGNVPIANKKIRLERDENLYQVSQRLADDKDKITLGLSCMKEARAEMEEKKDSIQFNQFNQYNQITDEELIRKKKEIEEKINNRIIDLKRKEQDAEIKVT